MHPLIGKRIVDSNPRTGEVTRKKITDTLGKTVFHENAAWSVNVQPERHAWVVTHDSNGLITDVDKHY